MSGLSILLQKNVLLKDYTSWGIGGPADYFVMPSTVDELKSACSWAQENNQPVTILGGGSNVLVSDKGIRGLTICLRKLSSIEFSETDTDVKVTCLSGTGKNELLKFFLKQQLAPALFLAGLPGDVGGGVVMNAGVAEAFIPREFGEIVEWIEVLEHTKPGLPIRRYLHDEIHWSYRHSDGWKPGIVIRVGISWRKEKDSSVLQKVKDANKVRLSKQPLDMPSCGSVFVNPAGHKAAQLIDGCGLKGLLVGDAQVSTKHANFIVNLGNATAQNVLDVIKRVQTVVLEKKGVQLKTEVVCLGEWDALGTSISSSGT